MRLLKDDDGWGPIVPLVPVERVLVESVVLSHGEGEKKTITLNLWHNGTVTWSEEE